MTQPKNETPQEFIEKNADDLNDLGHRAWGEAARTMNPDNDPTDFSGGGTFSAGHLAHGIATDMMEKAREHFTGDSKD